MHGIYIFMENKLKIILFLMSNMALVIADENQVLNHEYAVDKPSKIEDLKSPSSRTTIFPVILYDSNVFLATKGTLSNISGSKKIGSFVYELNAGNLKKQIEQNESASRKVSVADTGYRLVQIPGMGFLISDGSFIVKFKSPADKDQVNAEYSLSPRYEMPDATSYVSKDFSGLEGLIKRIEADPRVLSVELDLIDPYIQEQ